MLKTPLSGFAEMMRKNREEWARNLPRCSQAAEALNQSYQSMFDELKLPLHSVTGYSLAMLSFGSFASWIDAHLHSASGQLPSGWGDLRRAIEYTCYCAKIGNSEKRAKYWHDQKNDAEARRRFSLEFSLPLCYTGNKYRYLRRLLVAHDWANYYGAHGGFEALVGSYKEFTESQVQFTHPANKIDLILCITTYIVFLGLEMLFALKTALSAFLEGDAFPETLRFAEETVRQAKKEAYEAQFGLHIPASVLKVIHEGNEQIVDEQFEELVEKEKGRVRRSG